MSRPSLLLTLLLTLTLVAVSAGGAALPESATLSGTVTWVYDADTLEVTPHGKVRLLGIDAPEKGDSDRDEKFVKLGIARKNLRAAYGAGLSWCLHHVKGSRVTLSFGEDRRDRHGRLLAYVHLADGRQLNRVLLEEGLVIVYRRFPFAFKQDFLAAEADARQRGAGLWAR